MALIKCRTLQASSSRMFFGTKSTHDSWYQTETENHFLISANRTEKDTRNAWAFGVVSCCFVSSNEMSVLGHLMYICGVEHAAAQIIHKYSAFFLFILVHRKRLPCRFNVFGWHFFFASLPTASKWEYSLKCLMNPTLVDATHRNEYSNLVCVGCVVNDKRTTMKSSGRKHSRFLLSMTAFFRIFKLIPSVLH